MIRRLFPKLIRLLFLVLAGSTVVSLLADLLSTSETPRNLWTIKLCLLASATMTVSFSLDTTERRIKKFSTEARLPDWVIAQAEKNQSRAVVFFVLGFVTFLLVDFARRGRWIVDELDVGFKSFRLAVQIGAFLGEYVILNAQIRLVEHVEAWVKQPDGLLAGSEV